MPAPPEIHGNQPLKIKVANCETGIRLTAIAPAGLDSRIHRP